MTGNLSHQIEHHLFPDLPARRYPQIAAEVQRDLRALRPGLQHRSAAQAARQRGAEDLPAALPGSRRRAGAGPSSRSPWLPDADARGRLDAMEATDERTGSARPRSARTPCRTAVDRRDATVGTVTTIITAAVGDIARAVGGFATELFEIRDSARRAGRDHAGRRPDACPVDREVRSEGRDDDQ